MKKISLLFFTAIITCLCYSQNVGIGTTTPVVRLHVATNQSNLALFDGGDNMYLTFSENNISRGYIGSFAGNPEDVDFGTYGTGPGKVHLTTFNVPRLTVSNNGNVGIGTTTPEQLFSVAGGMVIDQSNLNTGAVTHTLRFGSLSGEAIGSKRNAGTNQYGLDFYTQGIHRMTIANNGNVGIGTNTPSAKLDINGDLNVESKILLNNSAGNNGQVLVSGGNGSPASWRNTAFGTNDRFLFLTTVNHTPTGFDDTLMYTTFYSGSSAITYNNGLFTVNKSGLYAVEATFSMSASLAISNVNSPLFILFFNIKLPSSPNRTMTLYYGGAELVDNFGSSRLVAHNISYNKGLYLAAGTQFSFYGVAVGSQVTGATGFLSDSPLSIYLIAE
jgi:hypothetical protein